MANKEEVSSKIVLKSGFWYTVSNFLFKGMAFITTPIFTRIMSKGEYGDFSNFASWMSILVILTGCDLHTSIIRSKLEFEDDLDGYCFSMLTLSTVITAIWLGIALLGGKFLFGVMEIDMRYIPIMFLYLFASPGFYIYTTKDRAYYKYKAFTVMTGLSLVMSTVLSTILVLTMENKLTGRILGQYLPLVILGGILYMLIAQKGRRIRFSYWKYALIICIPLVPHLLSMVILSSSDRIIITKLSGAEYTAIYSVAYSCAHIVSVLLNSMNKAWAPWLLDMLHIKKYESVKKTTTPYYLIFLVICLGVMLVAPEVILVLGGERYRDAIYVLPPLIVGCIFQFAYTMYVQLEFYEKKTKTIAIGTIIAAVLNIGLNFIFIPYFGYIAAAYTTLVGYICLFIIHYRTICKMGYKEIFDRKVVIGGLFISLALIPVFLLLYHFIWVRYGVIAAAGVLSIFIIWKKRELLMKALLKK